MNKILYLFLILCAALSMVTHAQTPEQNLQKYWKYRQRLEDKFVWVSKFNEAGSNLPLEVRDEAGMQLFWDDGNNCFSTYLGMLATEYKLLKDNNQDYSRTLNELYYALLAMERLDTIAETKDFSGRLEFASCSKNGVTGPPKFDGYFIRDDVDATTITNGPPFQGFSPLNCHPTFFNGGTGAVMSKDVCWNLMVGFGLVRACVYDDQTIFLDIENNPKTIMGMLRDICSKILDQLHGKNSKGHFFDMIWKIYSPGGCTIDDPPASGDVYEDRAVPYQYGFMKDIAWIADYEPYTLDGQGDFNSAADLTYDAHHDNYKFLALYSVMKDPEGHAYNYIQKSSSHAKPYKYPHFLLHYEVLHRDGRTYGEDPDRMKTFYEWLNSAPESGPSSSFVGIWSSTNALTQPGNHGRAGDYNGLDYMLLHNLWWLVYQRQYSWGSRINKLSITQHFRNVDNTFTDGTQNPYSPAVINEDVIFANNQLNSNRDVTYNGNLLVELNPGFETEPGANFVASSSITDDELTYAIYGNPFKPLGENPLKSAQVEVNSISMNNTSGVSNQKQPVKCSVSIFPNPCLGKFSCIINDYMNQSVIIEVINSMGISLIKKNMQSNTEEFDISSMPEGIYTVKVLVGSELFINKIIKQ